MLRSDGCRARRVRAEQRFWRDTMSILSRRSVLLASVSVLALAGALFYVQSGTGRTLLQFTDDKDKPYVSFGDVRKTLDPYINSVMDRSEKDFGVKYNPDERERIRARVWDRIQLVFSGWKNNKDKRAQ